MTKIERLMGQIIVDFANAENTDEACVKYFENMQRLLKFPHALVQQVKGLFPSLVAFNESLSDSDKDLLTLILEEKRIKDFLNDQLGMINYILTDYVCTTRTLMLVQFSYEDALLINGEPDVSVTYDDPVPVSLEAIKGEIEGILAPKTSDELDKLMEVGLDILEHKSLLPEDRYKELYKLSGEYHKTLNLHQELRKIQEGLRNVLDGIIQSKYFGDIPELGIYADIYNRLPGSRVVVEEDLLMECPPIAESDYLGIVQPHGWIERSKKDLAYCLIKFLKPDTNKKYIGKCQECQKHFIATRLNEQKFCKTACRLGYHNRKRIESGEAAKYKKRKRREGAKESYYG